MRLIENGPDLRTDPMSRVYSKVRLIENHPNLRTDPMSRVFSKVRLTENDPDLRTWRLHPRVGISVPLSLNICPICP
jgi:hypothetical protein